MDGACSGISLAERPGQDHPHDTFSNLSTRPAVEVSDREKLLRLCALDPIRPVTRMWGCALLQYMIGTCVGRSSSAAGECGVFGIFNADLLLCGLLFSGLLVYSYRKCQPAIKVAAPFRQYLAKGVAVANPFFGLITSPFNLSGKQTAP